MRKAPFSILFFAVSSLSAASVDPALAGFWSLDAPGAQLVWQITTDGRYQVWGSFSDSGTIEAANGKWSTVSITKKRQSGTYSATSTALSSVGPQGPAHWTRETGSSLAGGIVPKDVPKMAQAALALLRRTVPDASLVMVEVKKPSPVAHPIGLRFYSKTTNHIYVAGDVPFMDLGPPNSEELPLPADFIDLSRAIATARSNGMKGVFGNAILMTVVPPRGAPCTVWQVFPAQWDGELARTVDAKSGKPLDTARITPMVGTDAEIMAAVRKIQGVVQAGVAQAAPAGGAGGPLASCGESVTFKGGDPVVTFSAIHLRFPIYRAIGDEDFYVVSRALTQQEEYDLRIFYDFLRIGYPPIVVIHPMPSDFYGLNFAEATLKQMAESGCK
jgi:hypothetical protein